MSPQPDQLQAWTPGRWDVLELVDGPAREFVVNAYADGTRETVASGIKSEANARLIASAPTMRTALERYGQVVNALRYVKDERDRAAWLLDLEAARAEARAALALAEKGAQ